MTTKPSLELLNLFPKYHPFTELTKVTEPQAVSSTQSSLRTLKRLRAETFQFERSVQQQVERRAAIDVGSGSTKVCIADVDVNTNQIIQVFYEGSFPVPYQTYLEMSPELSFNEEIQEKGLATFSKIQELLKEYDVTQVAAVATEAFRKAGNGEDFAERIQNKTGIPLKVISQKDEGAIAFASAIAASGKNHDELIVWDIGTGSFQITAENEADEELAIYMQSMGSVPFKNYIIRDIQGHDLSEVKSPNPISEEDWEKADALARSMGRHAIDLIKQKIKFVEGSLVGIGRLFATSVQPLGSDGKITRDDLRAFIRESIGYTDEELGDPFANVNTSNAILVLGVMKALHIHEIDIVETTSTKGILCYEACWNQPSPTIDC